MLVIVPGAGLAESQCLPRRSLEPILWLSDEMKPLQGEPSMEAHEPVSQVVTLSSPPADQICSRHSLRRGPFARVYLLAQRAFL